MLEGLLRAYFQITGTWPMRSEQHHRMIARGSNALASSIVLGCRPRPETASMTTRRDFMSALKKELPDALRKLQQGNIAPVDLAQAAIGPGMAVFSRYSKVIEADGSPMKVRTALALINQTLDEVLVEQEGEFDSDTRWGVAWFEQYGMNEGPYGVAETLSKRISVALEGKALLVRPEVATKQIEADKLQTETVTIVRPGADVNGRKETAGATETLPEEVTKSIPVRFYGSVELDATRLGRDAGKIAEEVVQHLTSLLNSKVEITLEIKAEILEGVPDNVVRTVNENCRTLKFKKHGFEEK